MKKLAVLLSLSLVFASMTTCAYAEQYVSSFYGGDLNSDDAVIFANEVDKISGWSKKTVNTEAYAKRLKDANSSTIIYWSSHGYPWTNKPKLIVLAACNQIKGNTSGTWSWGRTMLSATNRVNIIVGYNGLAPGSPYPGGKDDAIAKAFARYMLTKKGFRILQ